MLRLIFLGAITPRSQPIALYISVKTNVEVHRQALATAALLPLIWGYFSSPVLFYCISGIAIVNAWRIYIFSS